MSAMDTPEELIERYSHRPDYAVRGSISVSAVPKPSTSNRTPVSSLGCLSTLPLEGLQAILRLLDFRSLGKFAQASILAKITVESLPEYHAVREHAGEALAALGCTEMIAVHSAATIYSALRSESCVSCGEFGAYLFLPTCERCCRACLSYNQSMWAIPRATAGKCFGLSARHLSQLPAVHSLVGQYTVLFRFSLQRRLRLVSVGAAKRLALKIHGSIEAMAEKASLLPLSADQQTAFSHFRDAPLEPVAYHPPRTPSIYHPWINRYGGMASVFFPSLVRGGEVEHGLWCRGCQLVRTQYNHRTLDIDTLGALIAPGYHPVRVFWDLAVKGRSRAGFLDHIKTCPGVRELRDGSGGGAA